MSPRTRHRLARLAFPATLLLLALPDAASAQEDVMRDVYRFYGSELHVRIATETAGRIRLLRGRDARIEVAARAPDGFASAALGGRGVPHLTLTSLGGDRVDFVVVVPERVRVRIELPENDRSELFGTLTPTATYAWEPAEPRPAIESIRPGATRRESTPSGIATVTRTPSFVDIEHAGRVERITVRIEQGAFALDPSHRIAARRDGAGLRVEAPDIDEITLHVPANDRFTLRLDGRDAIAVDGSEVRLLCEAALSQTLPDGSRWITVTPSRNGDCDGTRREDPLRATPAARRT